MKTRTLILSLWLFCASLCGAQVCTVSPSLPQPAKPGECIRFTTSGGCNGNWSLTGIGTLDQTGEYCAPSTVYPQNYSRGIQEGPNDNVYNVSVYDWPVHPLSSVFVNRIANDAPTQGSYHNLKIGAPPRLFQNFFNNIVDDVTGKQKNHAVYPWCLSCQDTLMPLLAPPFVEMQTGWSMDVYGATNGGTGPDRHMLQADRTTQLQYEYYQVMAGAFNEVFHNGSPTHVSFDTDSVRTLQTPLRLQVNHSSGCSSLNFNGYGYSSFLATVNSQTPATNGHVWHVELDVPYDSRNGTCNLTSATLAFSSSNCESCNIGSMAVFSPSDNSNYGGADAGGSSLVRTSGDPAQWWDSVVNGYQDPNCGGCNTAFQHALRTTLSNQMLSARVIAPGTLFAAGGHPRIPALTCTAANPITCAVGTVNGQPGLAYSGADGCEAPTPWLTVTAGCKFHIVFTGLTGAWSVLNDNADLTNAFYATALDTSHFSIPVDGRSFGTGTWNGSQWVMFSWPAYGMRFRLKRDFNVEGFCTGGANTSCPFIKALLRTLQVYGLVVLDGTAPADDWDTGILSNGFYPDQLVDAATALHNWHPIEPYLEVVDPANKQPYWVPGVASIANNQADTTNQGRVSVCFSAACTDVNLIGTTVGIDPARVPLIPSGGQYQATVWVNGNQDGSHTCELTPSVPGASVTDGGLITAPSSLAAPVITTMVCTATAAPKAHGYATAEFMPYSPDGHLRLCLGCVKTTLIDDDGKTWFGQVKNRAVTDSYQPASGMIYAPLYGSSNFYPARWTGVHNGLLFGSSTSHHNDLTLHVALPNGSYVLRLYGEAGLGVTSQGNNVRDDEVNGAVVASWQDSFLLAGGAYRGYTKDYHVSVTNGVLSYSARDRQDTTASPYGQAISAIEIISAGDPPPLITTIQLPNGKAGARYAAQLGLSGGVAPFTWSVVRGAVPSGSGLDPSTGIISGLLNRLGWQSLTGHTYAFTVQVEDSEHRTAQKDLTIKVVSAPLCKQAHCQ